MPAAPTVTSLLDIMEDGNEYGSIVGKPAELDLIGELQRALADIEEIRQRPCFSYIANVINPELGAQTAIQPNDHLPFREMVNKLPKDKTKVDVLIATPGGSAQEVLHFVDALRPRFREVDFILPYKAMSAGALWALSGDHIWMDERAYMGPIDPQVPGRDGTYVPAQALIVLLQNIQAQGEAALKNGGQPDWALVRLLDKMDQAALGAALTATDYAVSIATEFLQKYKFAGWKTRSSTGAAVTQADREQRAREIAKLLGSHARWKTHGHMISRAEVAGSELRIKIDEPENVPGFERAIRRLWALCGWIFDNSAVAKMIVSQDYRYVRTIRDVGKK